MSRRLALVFVPVLGLFLAGCGGSWATASGTVTLDGAPLKDGTVSFHPAGDGPTAYGTVKDGAFTVSTGQRDGLPVGKYKVTISASTIPEEGTKERAKMLTPPKYATAATTPLEADVTAGANTLKFEMSGK